MAKTKSTKSNLSKGKMLHMHRLMLDIRNFDSKVNKLVKKGMIPGMTHFSIGEEAANVGAVAAIEKGFDLITSNHRGHGQSIALEIDTLREHLLSLANTQDANGNYLFAGSRADQPAFGKDAQGRVMYQGDQARMQVNIGDSRRMNLNRPGSDVFVRAVRTDDKGVQSGVDFFQVLSDLSTAIRSSDHKAMTRGVSEVDVLQNGISEGVGQVGADQAVVDAQNGVLDQIVLQLKTSKSDVEDLDYTEAVTRMNRDELALQAAQSSFAKISQLSLFKFLG